MAYGKRHTVVTPSKRRKPKGLSSSAAKVKHVTHIIVIMAQQRPYMKDVNVNLFPQTIAFKKVEMASIVTVSSL